jgi:hypothetical protein
MKKEFRVIYTGRIAPVKNIDLLIDGVKTTGGRLSKDIKLKAEFHGGPDDDDASKKYDERLRRRVADEELNNIITFAGPYEPNKLPGIYRQADVLVLTSESEAGPLVVMEAMMYATPVVATDVGSVRSLLLGPDGRPRAGIVIERTTDRNQMLEDLAGALVFLAENPEIAKSMAAEGRKTAKKEFSIPAMVTTHLKLFETLCPEPKEPLRLSFGGFPFSRDGIQTFNLSLLQGIKRTRPEISLQMHTTLPTPTRRRADPAVLRTLDAWTIQLLNGDNHPGSPSEELINEIVCPALRKFLTAIKHIELGDGFSSASEAPQKSKPETTLLESAGNALVTLSDFFDRHRAYRNVVDSAAVGLVFEKVFPELTRSQLDHLRDMLTGSAFGLPILLERFNAEKPHVIYRPNADFFVFSAIVDKISRESQLVVGMHSMGLKLMFQHLHLGETDGISATPYLDFTRSYSQETRRALQKYVGLAGHLVFHYTDCIIHYTADTQRWIEQHYRVPSEKSVQMKIGIPDRIPMRKLPSLGVFHRKSRRQSRRLY